MTVYNSEVVIMLVSSMKFPLSTEQGLNRMDGKKSEALVFQVFPCCFFCSRQEILK